MNTFTVQILDLPGWTDYRREVPTMTDALLVARVAQTYGYQTRIKDPADHREIGNRKLEIN